MRKFKVGDEVKILSKTVRGWGGLEYSGVYKGGGPFYIKGFSKSVGAYIVNSGKNSVSGDYFNEEDLLHVKEGEKKVARRTFKLLKEAPGMRKGALLQEECEDGTQPYSIINGETHSKDSSFKISFADRSLVEDQPQFFVEVFKVEPEYMTKEELTKWEEFKKGTNSTKRKYVRSGKFSKKANK